MYPTFCTAVCRGRWLVTGCSNNRNCFCRIVKYRKLLAAPEWISTFPQLNCFWDFLALFRFWDKCTFVPSRGKNIEPYLTLNFKASFAEQFEKYVFRHFHPRKPSNWIQNYKFGPKFQAPKCGIFAISKKVAPFRRQSNGKIERPRSVAQIKKGSSSFTLAIAKLLNMRGKLDGSHVQSLTRSANR